MFDSSCYVLLCFCYDVLCFAMLLLCFAMFCYVSPKAVHATDGGRESFPPICNMLTSKMLVPPRFVKALEGLERSGRLVGTISTYFLLNPCQWWTMKLWTKNKAAHDQKRNVYKHEVIRTSPGEPATLCFSSKLDLQNCTFRPGRTCKLYCLSLVN